MISLDIFQKQWRSKIKLWKSVPIKQFRICPHQNFLFLKTGLIALAEPEWYTSVPSGFPFQAVHGIAMVESLHSHEEQQSSPVDSRGQIEMWCDSHHFSVHDICGTWDKTQLKLLWWKQRLSVRKEYIMFLHASLDRDWLKRWMSTKNEREASLGRGLRRVDPALIIRWPL